MTDQIKGYKVVCDEAGNPSEVDHDGLVVSIDLPVKVGRLPTHHDLHITTPTIPRTSIFNLPFRVQVQCTRLGGWQAWARPERGVSDKDELLGGEYDRKWLVLDVAGHVICDSRDRAVLDIIGEALDKYSWALDPEASLAILRHKPSRRTQVRHRLCELFQRRLTQENEKRKYLRYHTRRGLRKTDTSRPGTDRIRGLSRRWMMFMPQDGEDKVARMDYLLKEQMIGFLRNEGIEDSVWR